MSHRELQRSRLVHDSHHLKPGHSLGSNSVNQLLDLHSKILLSDIEQCEGLDFIVLELCNLDLLLILLLCLLTDFLTLLFRFHDRWCPCGGPDRVPVSTPVDF